MANLPPASFSIQTERFLLRPMVATDATLEMESWMEDEIAVEMLNATQRRWTVADQTAFISEHEARRDRCLIGVFPHGKNRPIGLYIVKLRPREGLLLLTQLLGDTQWRGTGAAREGSIALLEYFFDRLSYAKAKANVRPGNKAMQWLLFNGGWRLEARLEQHLHIMETGERSDLLVFGILADEWRANRNSASTVPRRRRFPGGTSISS